MARAWVRGRVRSRARVRVRVRVRGANRSLWLGLGLGGLILLLLIEQQRLESEYMSIVIRVASPATSPVFVDLHCIRFDATCISSYLFLCKCSPSAVE